METALIPHFRTAPYWDQYVGVWAIRDQEAFAMAELAKGFDLEVHLRSEQAKAATAAGEMPVGYSVENGIATIEIRGTLMKQVSSFSSGTSTVMARRAIRSAVRNPEVNSIMLVIDSPGGTVAGTKELADEIAAAAGQKTVHAFIEDLGASAAYWIASQATTVSAGPMALVGSIGTFTVVQDWSAAAAKEGVKVHVVRAGDFKGTGVLGTEVTQPQLAEIQRTVNALNSFFLSAVESGRKMTREHVAELADGRVHIASEAKRIGLIDHVQTLDQAMQSMMESKPTRNAGARATDAGGDVVSNDTGGNLMSEAQVTGPKAATIAEIKAECVGASADFVLAQAEAAATIEQAKSAWMKQLAEQNAQLKADSEKAKAEAAKAQTTAAVPVAKPGVSAIVQSAAEDVVGTAKQQWDALVAENCRTMSLDRAIVKANRTHPHIRQAMVAEANAARA